MFVHSSLSAVLLEKMFHTVYLGMIVFLCMARSAFVA